MQGNYKSSHFENMLKATPVEASKQECSGFEHISYVKSY